MLPKIICAVGQDSVILNVIPYDPELGSVVYTPGECAQGIYLKCLEAEATYHQKKFASKGNWKSRMKRHITWRM